MMNSGVMLFLHFFVSPHVKWFNHRLPVQEMFVEHAQIELSLSPYTSRKILAWSPSTMTNSLLKPQLCYILSCPYKVHSLRDITW